MTASPTDTTIKDALSGEKNGIVEGLIYQITNHPKPLTTLYLDYDKIPDKVVMRLFETNDFSTFSNEFCTEFKSCLADTNQSLYKRLVNTDLKLRIRNFQYNTEKDEFDGITKINELGAEYFKELLVVRGTIVMISENRIRMKKAVFQCNNCAVNVPLDFNAAGGASLDKCFACGTENSFIMIPGQAVMTNTQVLTIEELSIDSSKNPVSIDILIDGDLVNKFEVGEIVVVSGNLRLDVFNDSTIAQVKRKVSTNSYHYNMLSGFGGMNNGIEFDYIMEANHIGKIAEKSIKFHDLTDEERERIEGIKNNPYLIDMLVQSFAPRVYGEEIKKEALLYQLVGGLGRSIAPDIDNRGEIHVLLFGDSGTAKTRLMLFSQEMSSKTRYGVGRGVSKPGLTGGVDTIDNKRVLTAGDAVLTDMGLLALDEMSEIPEEALNSLKEIMEKQTATTTMIRRGTFRTRTSILGASNPKKGISYNPNKNFSENIGMSHSLMTRFDVIYLFRDIPGLKDRKITDTILKSYDINIEELNEEQGILPKELLAKYIFLAKNSGIVPQLTKEAKQRAQDFYDKLRGFDLSKIVESKLKEEGDELHAVSFSARQFESIIRLATARSRLSFRMETDENDIEAAIKIINHMLETVGVDSETGKIDMNSIFSTKSANQENKEHQFISLLEKLYNAHPNGVPKELFIMELIKQSKWKEVSRTKIENEIKGYEVRNTLNCLNDIITLNYEQYHNR